MHQLLKWAGGKRHMVDLLTELMPHPYFWVEPFCGSAIVYAATCRRYGTPPYAILSDINERLVQCLNQVAESPEKVSMALEELVRGYSAPLSGESQAEYYYAWRRVYNETVMSPEATAALTLFLNRTCYNGLYRTNRRGEFNVPHGSYESPAFPDATLIAAWSDLLKQAEIREATWSDILPELEPHPDLTVYIDPPYLDTFASYDSTRFGHEDHVALEAEARRLASGGACVVAHNSLAAKDIWRGWSRYKVTGRRSISRVGSDRGATEEILATSFPVSRETLSKYKMEPL